MQRRPFGPHLFKGPQSWSLACLGSGALPFHSLLPLSGLSHLLRAAATSGLLNSARAHVLRAYELAPWAQQSASFPPTALCFQPRRHKPGESPSVTDQACFWSGFSCGLSSCFSFGPSSGSSRPRGIFPPGASASGCVQSGERAFTSEHEGPLQVYRREAGVAHGGGNREVSAHVKFVLFAHLTPFLPGAKLTSSAGRLGSGVAFELPRLAGPKKQLFCPDQAEYTDLKLRATRGLARPQGHGEERTS